jgi:uncharacterized protein YcbX
MAVVTELTVYPLKSAGGTSLTDAVVTPNGFRFDREFMLVRPGGRHLSQREVPRMAQLRPAFDGTKLLVDALEAVTPLFHEATDDGPAQDVTVHGDPCQGIDQGDEAADWFAAFLDTDCRLVRFTGSRPTWKGDGTLGFADRAPLNLASRESLDDLNTRLPEPLPMNRFRPSIVIEGLGAYAEDTVTGLRIGTVEIQLIAPCGRCVITTTDQESGLRGREPLRTLASYRTEVVDGDRQISFARLAVPRTQGTISVGDTVHVLKL